jgi:preprotein translocase subunit YajC
MITLLAQQPAQQPFDPTSIFMAVFLVAILYFMVIRPQKREADEKQKLLASLKKNDRVLTTGGMYGTIVNIKEDEVTLRVDDQAKVKVRFAKTAVAKVLGTDVEEKPATSDSDKKS